MHIDARNIDNNSIIEGDICIVGAGAAGVSIALEWQNTPYKVILLEGGGFEYDEKIQELYDGETTGQRYFPLKSTRYHAFGGTTRLWGGYCSPLDEIDFKKREWVEYSGWPITKRDLMPYYGKAIEYLDLHSPDFSVTKWISEIEESQELLEYNNMVWSKMWQFSPPTRFGIKYKDLIINATNIFLYTYANATNILLNEAKNKVAEIQVKNYNNKTHTIKAKHYILASNALQNTRLLLASNSQINVGIGNDHDNVGRYFMDHLEIKSAELWLVKPLPMELYVHKKEGTIARAEFSLTEKAQRQNKILNGTASLTALTRARYEKPYIDLWSNKDPRKNQYTTWEKIKKRLSMIKESTIDNIDRAYELFTRIEQAPNPNSRITLLDEKDSLGVPKISLHWSLTELDRISIRKMYEVIANEMSIADVARVRFLEFLQNENDLLWPKHTGGGWHHMGTTKMHNDPKQGVVDSNCKIHGIDNLYIAGSGCFPTSGSVNPTFTLVALSLRLSDYLKIKIK
jgi:choline dehydrogenase-like flavoprotein